MRENGEGELTGAGSQRSAEGIGRSRHGLSRRRGCRRQGAAGRDAVSNGAGREAGLALTLRWMSKTVSTTFITMSLVGSSRYAISTGNAFPSSRTMTASSSFGSSFSFLSHRDFFAGGGARMSSPGFRPELG